MRREPTQSKWSSGCQDSRCVVTKTAPSGAKSGRKQFREIDRITRKWPKRPEPHDRRKEQRPHKCILPRSGDAPEKYHHRRPSQRKPEEERFLAAESHREN